MFEVASSDLVNMGITVVSYTLKDIRDDEVRRNADEPSPDWNFCQRNESSCFQSRIVGQRGE